MRRDKAEALVSAELTRALNQHGPMRSPHEGWAVLYEELVKELGAEVFKNEQSNYHMMLEATQVAAMGLRFLIDLCDPPNEGHHED